MLSDQLKEETKINHQQTEIALVSQIRNITTPEDYAALLKVFYSYFGGLEKSIDTVIDRSALPDYDQRRKTSALKDDLQTLGAEIPATAEGNALPILTNHLQALGALYVIEGSTLGGKIISKMVMQKLATSKGFSFFEGYGADTEKMWGSFKETLNNQAKTPADEDAVIQAANETFLQFKNWIKNN